MIELLLPMSLPPKLLCDLLVSEIFLLWLLFLSRRGRAIVVSPFGTMTASPDTYSWRWFAGKTDGTMTVMQCLLEKTSAMHSGACCW